MIRKTVKMSLSSQSPEKLPKKPKLTEEEAQILAKLRDDYKEQKNAVKELPTLHPSQSLIESSETVLTNNGNSNSEPKSAKNGSKTSLNVINHKLGPEDLKKMNAARQLVKMEPIFAENDKFMGTENNNNNNESSKVLIPDKNKSKINSSLESPGSKIPQYVSPIKPKGPGNMKLVSFFYFLFSNYLFKGF